MLYHNDNSDFRDIIAAKQLFRSNVNIYNYNNTELKIFVLQHIKDILIDQELQQYMNRISYIILGAFMHVSIDINSAYNSTHIQFY